MEQPPFPTWLHCALEKEVAVLFDNVNEAADDFLAVEESVRLVEAFYTAMRTQRKKAAMAADEEDHSVQHEEAPREVKALFMDVFAEHTPLLHDSRFPVCTDLMDFVINQLCLRDQPITWGAMTGVIDFFLGLLRGQLDDLTAAMGRAFDYRGWRYTVYLEKRREASIFRSTCRTFWWDQEP